MEFYFQRFQKTALIFVVTRALRSTLYSINTLGTLFIETELQLNFDKLLIITLC